MKGCIPLTDSQISSIADKLSIRDRALLFMGVTTGLRISELLSLKVGDVWNNGQLADRVSVSRANTKKKVEGKTKRLIEPARRSLIAYLDTRLGLQTSEPLFRSRKGFGAITRRAALVIVKGAARELGLSGKIGTHSMRKSYAKKVYDETGGDYMKCKFALGHRSVASTESYLQFIREDEIDAQVKWDL